MLPEIRLAERVDQAAFTDAGHVDVHLDHMLGQAAGMSQAIVQAFQGQLELFCRALGNTAIGGDADGA